jgi:thiamine pyrophosphate-dependent acetolactate synthase large subunit-like protein
MGRHLFDVLAEVAAQERPGACFALMGDANMNWATVLGGMGCDLVLVRHEHCAVAAAMAHARKTGGVGLATVTCGPGLTQVLTALPAAVRARIPLVVFAGEAPLRSGWYNQAIDQAPFVTATGAAYHSLHHAGRAPAALRDAFLQARLERRPVVVGVPFDLQETAWTADAALPAPSAGLMPQVGPMPPHPDDIARVAARIATARRIVVMAGLGAAEAGAGPALAALAARADALLGTTLPARGLFAGDPFSLGIVGGFATPAGRALLGEADLVLGFGTVLAHHNSDGGKLFGDAHVVQIDTAPVVVSQGRIAAHSHVRGDARLAAGALAEAVAPKPAGWRSPATATLIRETPVDTAPLAAAGDGHDPRAVIAALEAALPQGWEMVNSSGHCSYYAAQMPSRPQDRFLTIREFGAIGNGIAFAMGVAVARPDRPAVLFDGDGSLLMHVQELETIRRHGLKLLVCVLNDGAYGSEIHKLRAEGLPDGGAVFGRPDFAAIARGFGLEGAQVGDLAALPGLVARFAAGTGAMVLDFPISDRVVSPVIRRAHAGFYGAA